MQNTYWRNNKDERRLLKKNIPLTLLKGLCVRGSWRLHRSLSSGASVYDSTAGFYLVHIVSQARLRDFFPITAIGMYHFRRLWNSMFGRVEGQYTTVSPCPFPATITVTPLALSSWLLPASRFPFRIWIMEASLKSWGSCSFTHIS